MDTDSTTRSTGLDSILKPMRGILLDFDGPVCRLFNQLPGSLVAAQLYSLMSSRVSSLAEFRAIHNPVLLADRIANSCPSLAREVHTRLAEMEVEAAKTARQTSGLIDLLVACRDTNRLVAIVSNNSHTAVSNYLEENGLSGYFHEVQARSFDSITLMKPSSYLVTKAINALGCHPAEVAFVGDASIDIQAARSAGCRAIGYATKPSNRNVLCAAQPDGIISDLIHIADAFRRIEGHADAGGGD